MKKIKLLFTLPVIATTLIPLASCNKPQTLKMTMISQKEKQTNLSLLSFAFNFSETVDKSHINFRIYNETAPAGGMSEPSIVLDGRDLYLFISFEQYEYSTYTFDVEFNVNGAKFVFEKISRTLIPATNILPEGALVINDGVLEGLDPDFEILSIYDTLQIPAKVTSIKANAFKDTFTKTKNTNITTLILNSNLTSIGANAFSGCNAITTLDVSNIAYSEEECAVTIETDAFADWAIAGTIKYPSTHEYYNLLDYQLCDQGLPKTWFNAAYRPTVLSDFNMTSYDVVGGFAWDANGTMPKHMTDLVNILSIPERCTTISNNAFYNSATNESLIPSNIKLLYLPDGVRTIGDYVFAKAPLTYSYSVLGHFKLPYALTTIGKYGFAGSNIKHVKFNTNLETIGDYAFYNCQNLAAIDVSNIKTIPSGWSTNGTFTNLAGSGEFTVIPSTTDAWRSYFENFNFDFTKWIFSNEIDLLSPTTYKPSALPIAQKEFTKESVLSALKTTYNKNPSVAIDDITYTFFDGNRAGYHKLSVYFSDMKIDTTGHLTFSITYNAETNGTPSVISRGSWTFYNLSLNTLDSVTADTETKIMTFKFKTLFDSQSSFIYVNETVDSVAHSAIINSDATLLDENLGTILTKLGLFDSINKLLKIDSRYFGNCEITE